MSSPSEDALIRTMREAAAGQERVRDYPRAVEIYRNLHEKLPNDLPAALGLARNLRYSGAAKQGADFLNRLKDRHRNESAFALEFAKAKLAVGRANEALALLKGISGAEEENWNYHSTLGIAYDGLERFDDAKRAYEKALQLSHDNPVVLNNLALSRAQAGDLAGAQAALEKASRLSRDNPQIRQNLALVYGVKGDLAKAEALARLDLSEDVVRHNMGFFHRFQGAEQAPETGDRSPGRKP
jgi:Flp pilus assembly protein TadD